MNAQISGNGPTVVFIHGYCESMSIWHRFEAALSKQFQVVLIDLPGHGKSALRKSDFTIDDIADEVHAFLAIKNIDKFFVIGHSLGGYIALALADLYSDSLLGFGLFQSSTFADDAQKKRIRDKVIKYIQENGVASFTDTFVPTLFAQTNKKRLAHEIEALKKEAAQTRSQAVIGFANAMKTRPDRTHIFSNFNKPIFILAGEKDEAVPLQVSNRMIAKLKNGDSLVLPGAGHNGFYENKKESLEFVKKFLKNKI